MVKDQPLYAVLNKVEKHFSKEVTLDYLDLHLEFLWRN